MLRFVPLFCALLLASAAPAAAQRIEKLPEPATRTLPPPVTAAPAPIQSSTQTGAQTGEKPIAPMGRIAGEPQSDGQPVDTLLLDEVLRTSARFAPQILEALDKARAAGGRALSAKGAFDLVFEAETYQYISGFYDGQYLNVEAIQPLTNNGGRVEGGYRLSTGDFPVYNDFFFTNRVGELKVRGIYALLRDKNIDDRRFGVANTLLGQDIAGLEAVLVAIGVQQRAIEAYNQWVGSGQQVVVFRELLNLAEERQAGLKRQVQLGAQPDIILTENEQNILRRQTLLVRAETDLERAANRLSLFWRTDAGQPRQPSLAQLPKDLPDIQTDGALDLSAIMNRRPDLKIIENSLNQARLKLQLDENELLPKFDVFAEFSNDFGGIGVGGPSRDGFETIVGLNFSVPLQRRDAKGRIAESEAKIDALARARQQVEEGVNNLVNDLAIAVDAAERLVEIARQEEIRAKKLAIGERRLFQVGASDFFLVNIREENAANAAIRRLQAQFELQKLHADQLAVAADTDALGLEAMGTGGIRVGE